MESSTKRTRKSEGTRMKEIIQHILAGLMFVFALFVLVYILIGLTGCTKTEIKYIDKPYEVKVAVPQKCEFNLPPRPVIKNGTMKEVFATTALMIADSKVLRKKIKKLPCVILKEDRIIYVDLNASDNIEIIEK